MLDQTLSYAHRPGRIDITVHRHADSTSINNDALSSHHGGAGSGPFHAPIYMHSYCKVRMTYLYFVWRAIYSFEFVIDGVLLVSIMKTSAKT